MEVELRDGFILFLSITPVNDFFGIASYVDVRLRGMPPGYRRAMCDASSCPNRVMPSTVSGVPASLRRARSGHAEAA
jgi:hypothetical protein